MTLDEAIARASEKIDELLTQRWDDLALRMIEDGVDPDADESEPPDVPGDWRRLSFKNTLQHQKELDLEWRAETLVQLRINLAKEFNLS
jgi:hypothetical protein